MASPPRPGPGPTRSPRRRAGPGPARPRAPATDTTGEAAAGSESASLADLAEAIERWPGESAPLPLPMIDGFLVGVLLQRRPVPFARWWPAVFDGDGPPPAGAAADQLRDALSRRHAELGAAIARRQWFDPWILQPAEPGTPHDAVFPWVAGFAHAMASFEDLGDTDDPAFDEPLALLYQHLDAGDLENADTLLDVIRALPPPQDLTEAVEQLVRATLLIADETRPIAPAPGTR